MQYQNNNELQKHRVHLHVHHHVHLHVHLHVSQLVYLHVDHHVHLHVSQHVVHRNDISTFLDALASLRSILGILTVYGFDLLF